MTYIETVKSVLANIKNDDSLCRNLADNANIIEDVGLDSLETLQFMLEIEEALSIIIDFDALEFEHMYSIDVLAEFLKEMPVSEQEL